MLAGVVAVCVVAACSDTASVCGLAVRRSLLAADGPASAQVRSAARPLQGIGLVAASLSQSSEIRAAAALWLALGGSRKPEPRPSWGAARARAPIQAAPVSWAMAGRKEHDTTRPQGLRKGLCPRPPCDRRWASLSDLDNFGAAVQRGIQGMARCKHGIKHSLGLTSIITRFHDSEISAKPSMAASKS